MPKHVMMAVRAQALAYQDANLSWHQIAIRTGMSIAALAHLFRKAKSVPLTMPLTVLPRKAGSGKLPKITKQMMKAMKKVLDRDRKLSAKALNNQLPSLCDVKVRTIQDVL